MLYLKICLFRKINNAHHGYILLLSNFNARLLQEGKTIKYLDGIRLK